MAQHAAYVMSCRFHSKCVVVWNKDGEGAKDLENIHSEKLKVVQLDVCSEEQVSQALQFITANLEDPEKGEDCLWMMSSKVISEDQTIVMKK